VRLFQSPWFPPSLDGGMTRGEGEGSYYDAGDTSALSQSLSTTRARRDARSVDQRSTTQPTGPCWWYRIDDEESLGRRDLGEASSLSALADKIAPSIKEATLS
jgi:hypothetical protein